MQTQPTHYFMKVNQLKPRGKIYRANHWDIVLFFSLTLFLFSCNGSDEVSNTDSVEEELIETAEENLEGIEVQPVDGKSQVEIPENYTILDEATGDLDGDGIEEKVVVFDTGREEDFGTVREVRIYVDQDEIWSLWYAAIGPVLPSEHGGMMGDPYEGMSVSNGTLEISHFGGSAEKWSYNHEFQYVNDDWQLTQATLLFYRSCEYSETYTYNILKGTGFHSRNREACDQNGETIDNIAELEEALVIDKGNEIPKLVDFNPGGTEVTVNNGENIYYY